MMLSHEVFPYAQDTPALRAGVPATDGVYGIGETIALGALRRLVDARGAKRSREILQAVVAAELAPITADHIRVAEALLCDEDYRLAPDVVTRALRDISPRQTAEAAEVAFAKRIPAWRALTAVLYRAHAAPKRGRAKVAVATQALRSLAPAGTLDALLQAGAVGERERAAGMAYGRLRLRFEAACRAARHGGAGAMPQPMWFALKRRHEALIRAAAFDRYLLDRVALDGEAPLSCEVDRVGEALERVAVVLDAASQRASFVTGG